MAYLQDTFPTLTSTADRLILSPNKETSLRLQHPSVAQSTQALRTKSSLHQDHGRQSSVIQQGTSRTHLRRKLLLETSPAIWSILITETATSTNVMMETMTGTSDTDRGRPPIGELPGVRTRVTDVETLVTDVSTRGADAKIPETDTSLQTVAMAATPSGESVADTVVGRSRAVQVSQLLKTT